MGCSVEKKNELNEDIPSGRLGSMWRCMVGSVVRDYQLG